MTDKKQSVIDLEGYIRVPTVIVDKDGVPYEYSDATSFNMTKSRAAEVGEIANSKLTRHLKVWLINNDISYDALERFASGSIKSFSSMQY